MKTLISSKTNYSKFQTNKPVMLWDTRLTGFGVKINPSGKHCYIIQFRQYNKTKRVTVAPVFLLSLSQAKSKAPNYSK